MKAAIFAQIDLAMNPRISWTHVFDSSLAQKYGAP